jgi:hypothetical protein
MPVGTEENDKNPVGIARALAKIQIQHLPNTSLELLLHQPDKSCDHKLAVVS